MRLTFLLVISCISVSALAQPATKTPTDAAEPPVGSVGGMGDVNLYPKRVVIDQRQRVASIGLFNRAASQGDYDISISDMMMTPEGGLVDLKAVSDPAQLAKVKTASSLLRWSPHKVTLGSHDSQTVRIMARVAPDLPPGEYRSHFFAVAKPPVSEGGFSIEEAVGARPTSGIGVVIIPRFGISIPVIVRVGETTLSTALRDVSVTTSPEGMKLLSITITREGTRSAFGDMVVTAAGSNTRIAESKGIGVYPEVNQRTIQLAINPDVNPSLYARGAKLTVTYTDDDFAPGKTLAKQDFTVP